MNKVTGNLTKRGNYWYTTIHYYHNGKRKTKHETTNIPAVSKARTQRGRDKEEKHWREEAEAVLYERKRAFQSAYSLDATVIPFYNWVERWLDSEDQRVKNGFIQASTVEIYRQQAEKHLVPYFKKHEIMLSNLTTKDINQFYQHVLTTGLSSNTVSKKIHCYVKKALDFAVTENLIQFNPARGATIPKSIKPKVVPYDLDEVQELFDLVEGTNLEVPVYLATTFGLRRSEVIGLRWESIDFDKRTLTIDNVTIYEKRRMVDKANAKNETSNRVLTLNDHSYKYLRSIRKKQKENQMRFGGRYIHYKHEYVCVKENGERITPKYVSDAFARLEKKYGLRKIKFHGLRHTCTSLLLNNGASLKDVQDWLGHADYNTTANIYGHIGLDRKRELGDIMENLFGSKLG